ncbi:hypothetical protein H9649_00150 [Sporosarcina sp. Sa2YVA2]|uniref:DUF1310 family protein n=1 Tax=Sporosarcina quadrami TaxID=2762234 RepID=A0ABR8U4L5_9BACL|nr:hypothetical protein [Sporosarcina quadrami]MBD7982973.1 hypothetical protein [Sporosarcina quadrami]
MKNSLKYVGIVIIGAIAVFLGNLLFTEYQSYKHEKEIEKVVAERLKIESAEAMELAIRSVEFGKPRIKENEDKYKLTISNSGDKYIGGYFYLYLYDDNNNEILRELMSIPSFGLTPYGDYVFEGYIDKEYINKVRDYKIKGANLYASQ